MKIFNHFFKLLFVVLVFAVMQSCVSVQPYQMMYLNNSDMNLSGSNLDEFNTNFQSYREGAVGGNDGNKGNGCGCN
jgi:hypothetical protein